MFRSLAAAWSSRCLGAYSPALVTALLTGCSSGANYTIVAPHADPGEVSVGLNLLRDAGLVGRERLTFGSAAYSGDNGQGDSYWTLSPNKELWICRPKEAGPACSAATMSGVDKVLVMGFLPSNATERRMGRWDPEPLPQSNTVWFWGVQRKLLGSAHFVGFCAAEAYAEAKCKVTAMPERGDIIVKLASVHELRRPALANVAWFIVRRGRGIGREGRDELLRCHSSPDAPIPTCATAPMMAVAATTGAGAEPRR